MKRPSQPTRHLADPPVEEQVCTLHLDVGDLTRLAESLVGRPFKLRRGPGGVLALTLPDLVPKFDVTIQVTAELHDPKTIRFSVDMEGVAGWIKKAFQVVGGLPWLVSQFAAHEAFTVDNAGHVDLHVERLPGDAAEWLTNRLVLRSFSIPGKGRSAAEATFTIKRFMNVV